MGIEYTGVIEMLRKGLSFGLLFGVGALAALWGGLYVLDRVFSQARNEEAHTLRLVESNEETLPKHRKAA